MAEVTRARFDSSRRDSRSVQLSRHSIDILIVLPGPSAFFLQSGLLCHILTALVGRACEAQTVHAFRALTAKPQNEAGRQAPRHLPRHCQPVEHVHQRTPPINPQGHKAVVLTLRFPTGSAHESPASVPSRCFGATEPFSLRRKWRHSVMWLARSARASPRSCCDAGGAASPVLPYKPTCRLPSPSQAPPWCAAAARRAPRSMCRVLPAGPKQALNSALPSACRL